MDLNTLGFESLSLFPFHDDGQIQGNFPQGMIDDLVCLPGFHPKEITVPHVRVHVRLEIASGYPPAIGERQGQETGRPEEDIVGGYYVLGMVDGHLVGSLGTTQMALKDEIQLGFIPAHVFLLSVHDESWVSLGPMTDGFEKAAKRRNVYDLDSNFLPVFLGQFTKPAGEQVMGFFHVLWIFIEVNLISFSNQTHLV
jgi:hypothetical protein